MFLSLVIWQNCFYWQKKSSLAKKLYKNYTKCIQNLYKTLKLYIFCIQRLHKSKLCMIMSTQKCIYIQFLHIRKKCKNHTKLEKWPETWNACFLYIQCTNYTIPIQLVNWNNLSFLYFTFQIFASISKISRIFAGPIF